MNDPSVDPVIIVKLAEFRQRWRRLLFIRIVCSVVITLLVAIAIAAALDWLFILPDWLRWLFAAILYGTTAIALCKNARQLLARRDDTEVARQVENLKPELREQLAAAVELGRGSSAQLDSAIFRRLVQKQVSAQIRDLEIHSLLPTGLIRPRLRLATVLTLISLVLFFLPHSFYRTLTVRALLPEANIARLSKTRLEIIAPDPAETIVARGDSVAIVAGFSGKPERHATLEFRSPGDGWELLSMTQTKPAQFSASLPISGETLEYRVLAGDAVTRTYRLTPKPRPHVIHFEKVYHYPRYAGLEPIKKIDDSGDISGLEGSEVELRLQLDQPVSKAELEIASPNNRTNLVKLTGSKDTGFQARITLSERQTYRVRLVSEQTGFENKFSPQYEIRPIADLPPNVQLTAPARDLAVAPDALIELAGRATDDLPLVSVSQWVRINDGAWKQIPGSNLVKTNGAIQTKWDLIGLNLSAGDHVETKVSAVDLKGSRVETPPIHVTIISATLDLKRMEVVEQHRRIVASFNPLRVSAEALARSFDEAAQNLRAEDADLQARQIALKLASQSEAFNLRINEVLDLIKAILPHSRAGRESAELVEAGDALLAMRYRGIRLIQKALNNTGLASEIALKKAAVVLNQIHASGNRFGEFVFAEQVQIRAESLWSLLGEQDQLLAESAQNPSGKEQIKRREIAATRSLVLVEQTFTNMTGAAVGPATNLVANSKNQLAAARIAFEAGLQGTSAITTNQISDYRNKVEDALEKTLMLSKGLSNETPSINNLNPDGLPPNWQAEFLDTLANIEELRLDSDSRFVSEWGKAASALRESDARPGSDGNSRDRDAQVLQALKTLQFAHLLTQIDRNLETLAQGEKWASQEIKGRTERPGNWTWSKSLFQRLPEELKADGLSNRISTLISNDATASAIARIDAEMQQRADLQRINKSIAPALDSLRTMLKGMRQEFAATMNDARKVLSSPIVEPGAQMQTLAANVEELQVVTRQSVTNVSTEFEASRDLLARQRKVNQEIDRMRSNLRQEANLQDTTTLVRLENARDIDDALALLRQPPTLAEGALQEALDGRSINERAQSFELAAAQQDKIARLLHRLGGYFQNPHSGASDNTRIVLRQSEEEMGIKTELEQLYKRPRFFAELGPSGDGSLPKLERELTNNFMMRQELRAILKTAIADAADLFRESALAQKSISTLLNERSKQEALAQQALSLGLINLSEAAKQIDTQHLPLLRLDAKKLSKTTAGLETATQSFKTGIAQLKLDIGQTPRDGVSKLKISAELIEKTGAEIGTLEHLLADGKAAAGKSEQETSEALAKSRTTDRLLQTNLLTARAVLNRIQTEQEKLNTEDLQHKFEQAQTAFSIAETNAAAAAASVEIAAKNAKLASEVRRQFEAVDERALKLNEQISNLARGTREMVEALEKLAQQNEVEFAKIAAAELPIQKRTEMALRQISRALLHAGQLAGASPADEKRASSDLRDRLKSLEDSSLALARKELPAVQELIKGAALSTSAQTPIEQLEKHLSEEAMHLNEILRRGSVPEISADRNNDAHSNTQSEWMARLLDQLGTPEYDPDSQAAKRAGVEEAFQAAFEASRASLANARAIATLPKLAVPSDPRTYRSEDWGGILSRVADDLHRPAQKTVSPQYQAMVDSYFKAVADKARQAMP